MKTILIPTDFSENSWNALDYALKFFRHEECVFYMLHVGTLGQSSIKGNSFAFPKEPLDPPLREQLKDLFLRIRKLPRNKRHRFIALQEYGNLVNVIKTVVKDKKIDLIVMGTKGATGLKQAVVGSNTGDVITKIQCDVLVIPEKATYARINEVAFATDYNIFYTNSILENLSEILRLTNTNIGVLNISKFDQPLLTSQIDNRDLLLNYLNEAFPTKIASQTVSNVDIVTAIEGFILQRNVGMLVMVAKSLNFLQQLLFDTTVEKLSFRAKVPLWVLHE